MNMLIGFLEKMLKKITKDFITKDMASVYTKGVCLLVVDLGISADTNLLS